MAHFVQRESVVARTAATRAGIQVVPFARPAIARASVSPLWHAAPGVSMGLVRPCVMLRAKGGTLDAPVTLPGLEKGTENITKRPPHYQVMLHNDNYNRREYVVKVLLKVIKTLTVDDAVSTMQVAHETGVAMVITCPQEDAERYCEGLRLNGLTSSIEPGRC